MSSLRVSMRSHTVVSLLAYGRTACGEAVSCVCRVDCSLSNIMDLPHAVSLMR